MTLEAYAPYWYKEITAACATFQAYAPYWYKEIISSTPSVFETVDFVCLDILIKSKTRITYSSAILTLTSSCLGPNPSPNGYISEGGK